MVHLGDDGLLGGSECLVALGQGEGYDTILARDELGSQLIHLIERDRGDERVETYFYGSAWFSYNPTDAGVDTKAAPGNYVVRTSGYAQFRDLPIPADGTVVDITALYTKYTNTAGRYVTYQLVLMDEKDVVMK